MPYKNHKKQKEYLQKYMRKYSKTPERKKYQKEYNQSPRGKEVNWKAHQKYANSPKAKEYQRKYYKTPNGRKTYLKYKYGITPEEYDRLFEQQHGKCAICFKAPIYRKLDIDHEHTTNKVRGLLCNNCNQALGLLGDSILVLREAIHYLEKF